MKMKTRFIFVVFVFLLGEGLCQLRDYVPNSGPNSYEVKVYKSQKYYYTCVDFDLSCTDYRSILQRTYYQCNVGWRTLDHVSCVVALCDGKHSAAACNEATKKDGDLKLPDGTVVKYAKGKCLTPDGCSDCIEGFYAKGAHCVPCNQIVNCDYETCTPIYTSMPPMVFKCKRCEGSYGAHSASAPGLSAYALTNGDKKCEQLCSWRSDSTPCWPGKCGANWYRTSCTCHSAFTRLNANSNCDVITHRPSVLSNSVIITNNGRTVGHNDLSNLKEQTIWVKSQGDFYEYAVEAEFKMPNSDELTPKPKYIGNYKIGISSVLLRVTFTGPSLAGPVIRSRDSRYITAISCGKNLQTDPADIAKCTYKLAVDAGLQKHKAKAEVEVFWRTSGEAVLLDGDKQFKSAAANSPLKYTETAPVAVGKVVYKYDFVKPYSTSTDEFLALSTEKVRKADTKVTVDFKGWADDDSGMNDTHATLFLLELTDIKTALMDQCEGGKMHQQVSLVGGTGSATVPPGNLKFDQSGVYSVVFMLCDKTQGEGNCQYARRFLTVDLGSCITIKDGSNRNFSSGSSWWNKVQTQTNLNQPIVLQWDADRYSNLKHHHGNWLAGINECAQVNEKKYDDYSGNRSRSAITNNQGVVKMEFGYRKFRGKRPNVTDTTITNYATQSITATSKSLNIARKDGDTVEFFLRLTDYFDCVLVDSTFVRIDSTPPIIRDAWLVSGKVRKLFVHGTVDFDKMMFEWEAYDPDSGLLRMSWWLYDNYTGSPIWHGEQHMGTQKYQDEAACKAAHTNAANGSDCYETPDYGWYHRDFRVQPKIALKGGLDPARTKGVHDAEYYLKLYAQNHAKLETTLIIKISVDDTAPHPGSVHDGPTKNQDRDHQSTNIVEGTWDSFMDPESGIIFYQYMIAPTCADASNFKVDYDKTKVVQTKDPFTGKRTGSWGKNYVTVVAWNAAYVPSVPVCSDGVIADQTPPIIEGLTMANTIRRSGLFKTGGKVYYVREDSRKIEITSPSTACSQKAATFSDVTYFPSLLDNKGATVKESTAFCETKSPLDINAYTAVTVDQWVIANWTGKDPETGIQHYAIGLASDKSRASSPDIHTNEFTKLGKLGHHKIFNTGLTEGKDFYVVITAWNQAMQSRTKVFGPYIVEVTPPAFSGTISTKREGDLTIAQWPTNAFSDPEAVNILTYHFGIGNTETTPNVQWWSPLEVGGSCSQTTPPTCTVVHTKNSPWKFHPGDHYIVFVRATNLIGLSTHSVSPFFTHTTDKPLDGVIMEVAPPGEGIPVVHGKAGDIDYQVSTSSISARWYGFAPQYAPVKYSVALGTTPGAEDVASFKAIGTVQEYTFSGLSLSLFKIYYVTLKSININGELTKSSDGVKIIGSGASSPIQVFDGTPSGKAGLSTNDIDYQASTSSLAAHWMIPVHQRQFVTRLYRTVEEQKNIFDPTGWKMYQPWEKQQMGYASVQGRQSLVPGRRYRTCIKSCHEDVCLKPVCSDGVLVLNKPPVPGNITEVIVENNGFKVSFERFTDPDVHPAYPDYARTLVDYKWAITAGDYSGRHIVNWQDATVKNEGATKASFKFTLPGKLKFKDCHRIALAGYSKAGLYTTVYKELKSCEEVKRFPPKVIDAYGAQVMAKDGKTPVQGKGKPISLGLNKHWEQTDKDYTSYTNILSAVWPKFRHRKYKFSVIQGDTLDVFAHYHRSTELAYKDPCAAPGVIYCGTTTKEYVNVEFNQGILKHGKRYYFCVHADNTTVKHERWTEELAEESKCSDGITVDLTPPQAGVVTIPTGNYLTSHTVLFVKWSGFTGVEKHGKSPFDKGISHYLVGIGTKPGEADEVDFKDVGYREETVFDQLSLQDGHTYYVMVKAYDYVGLFSTKISDPVTVDTTPPVKNSDAMNARLKPYHTSTTDIQASWEGIFSDPESGIKHYEVYVGSEDGYADVMHFTKTTDESVTSSNLKLEEGHSYYISVKSYNRAGLSTPATHWAVIVDASPPVAGHVFDGERVADSVKVKDKDYQTDKNTIRAWWSGFDDPHSHVVGYSWHIGTSPGADDVLKEHSVGVATEAHATNLHLRPGITYYITVTACNGAGLCTSVTSDGVIIDYTPPIVGEVHDGVDDEDSDYQRSRGYLAAKWWGFTDPQSCIDHYTWWVGTSPGGSDILPKTRLHHAQMAFTLGMLPGGKLLPINTRIYITVQATNKAGLFSQTTSNGFMVVTSPPTVYQTPSAVPDFGRVDTYPNTQIASSVFGVQWDIRDNIPIEEQYVRLHSTYQLTPDEMPTVRIGPHPKKYFFTKLKLQDGNKYYVDVTACNRAKICTSGRSSYILVDNTPPTPGTLATDTNHAANVKREEAGTMIWTSSSLGFAWVGFADQHSGIADYHIGVGTTYLSWDLTKGKTVKFLHSNTGTAQVEGPLQKGTVTSSELTPGTTFTAGQRIYVTLYATNKAGLQSHMVVKLFELEAGGRMRLIRRCTSSSCGGDCVCAPEKAKCAHNPSTCTALTGGLSLVVNDVLDTRSNTDVDFTPATCFLAARWSVLPGSTRTPIRYQVSVGLASNNYPTGLKFKDNVIWNDIGMQTIAIDARGIDEDDMRAEVKYAFFVRAWVSNSEYIDFRSDGVQVAVVPPLIAKQRGAAVKDWDGNSPVRDLDYFARPDTYYVWWKNVFIENHNNLLDRYEVSVSTYPLGDDTKSYDRLAFSSSLSYIRFNSLNLLNGRRYFGNVIAYNKAFLFSEAWSDGQYRDTTKPVGGIVYDGPGLHDIEYQSSDSIISAHWHGFIDLQSYIHHYKWCVGRTTTPTECGIRGWENVGLRTRVSANLTQTLPLGTKVYNKVIAVDAAQLESLPVLSDGVRIDTTGPRQETNLRYGANTVGNPSFESSGGTSWDLAVKSKTPIDPTDWIRRSGTNVVVVGDASLAQDGQNFAMLHGEIWQSRALKVNTKYMVSFYTSHIPSRHQRKLTQQGKVTFPNGEKHIFNLKERAGQIEKTHVTNVPYTDWMKHVYYFVASDVSGDLAIASVGEQNGILLDNVVLQEVLSGSLQKTGDHALKDFNSPLAVHGVFTDQRGNSIRVEWTFSDDYSPIVDYTWALGSNRGGEQVLGFKSVGRNTYGTATNLNLPHNSKLYVTVIATNAAGISKTLKSDAINIDMTPPVFDYVNDGDDATDIEFLDSNTVTATWSVSDPESGIGHCRCHMGSSPGSSNILKPTKVMSPPWKGSVKLNSSQAQGKIYTTVQCYNKAGGSSKATSNGVAIVRAGPSADNAHVEVVTGSTTVYPRQNGFQGRRDQIFACWSGFKGSYGIKSYEVRLTGKGVWNQRWLDTQSIRKCVRMTNLALINGQEYHVYVRGKNIVNRYSPWRSAKVMYTNGAPNITGNSVESSWNNNTLLLSWAKNVVSPGVGRKYSYEVSLGTLPGSANLIQWQETTKTSIALQVDPKYKSHLKFHLTVTAINEAGLYTNWNVVVEKPGSA